jgi:fructose-1,6-bisphosphatase/inositol monophosphatase family enzyme
MSQTPSAFLEQLGSIVKEASTQELLPRFRRLAVGEIMSKASQEDPTDLVTVADHAAETFLAERLRELVPGSLVVGEEAVAADVRLLERLHGDDLVWIIDPLDGTRYFAAGTGPFGPMVALVERGALLASAMHLPLADELFMAERNLGAFLNGARLATTGDVRARPRGTLFSKFMPPDMSARLHGRQASAHEQVEAPLCAAHEYGRLVRGDKEYSVYFRLMPWDHAPGALILREAGGVSRHPDGREYTPAARREPLLAARSEAEWRRVRDDLFAPAT